MRPGPYARAIFNRGVAAWRGGGWVQWRRDHAAEEARLEELRLKPEDLELDVLMHVLLAGNPSSDRRVSEWTRTLLGHRLGQHGSCGVCDLVGRREWWQVLRACETDPRTVRNFRDSLLAGHFANHTDFELARDELYWLRRDPDDF
ncbi:MAG TPA: hypothetical protein VF494_00995 [Candidatus Limnocylindrales bacterium]